MKTTIANLLLCGVVLGLSGPVSAAQQAPTPAPTKLLDSPAAAPYVEAARTAGGTQWQQAVNYFCNADPRVNDPSDPQLPPTKVFDKLYYVGAAGNGSWFIQTSEGLVMFDTGYPQHLETVLLPGMAALKLNPADVKYILIGHGIWDHWGGATHFQEKYGTRVVMGATGPGWEATANFLEGYLKPRQEAPPRITGGRPSAALPPNIVPPKFDPKRDINFWGTNVLTVGDTPFTIMDAPGGISVIFPIKDGAVTHMVGLFGATILIPNWQQVPRLKQHVETLGKWATLSKQMNVDVEIQNHPLYDGITEKIAAVRAGKKGAEHPFVVGKDGYQQYVAVMSECMKAQIAQREAAQN